MFVSERKKSFYVYSNFIYVNKNHRCRSCRNAGAQSSPFLSTNVGVSPCMGSLLPAENKTNLYIKIDKMKIKPYLQQNHATASIHKSATLETPRNHSNCSNKIKMPKNNTAYRLKSFIPMENINVEKLEIYQSQHK